MRTSNDLFNDDKFRQYGFGGDCGMLYFVDSPLPVWRGESWEIPEYGKQDTGK
jgi:hypothetical protein